MFSSLIVPWPRRSLKICCSLSPSCENIFQIGGRPRCRRPQILGARRRVPLQFYFFGVAAGVAEAAAPDSSIPNVQCASIFLSPDFAVKITVQFLSRNF